MCVHGWLPHTQQGNLTANRAGCCKERNARGHTGGGLPGNRAPPGWRVPQGDRVLMPSRCALRGREPSACSLDILFAVAATS